MNELPPFADSLTRHEYRLEDWRGTAEQAQQHAERQGHVPPAVRPVDVEQSNFPNDYVWQWLTGKDSTGQLKEIWFVDGPLAGTRPRMIEAGTPKGARVIFTTFDRTDDIIPGDQSPAFYTYEVDQRDDGLWFGRWMS